MLRVYIGWDSREQEAFSVARASFSLRSSESVMVEPLIAERLRSAGLLARPVEIRDGRMWDVISEAPQSTEFAISRFLTPILAQTGWVLFTDCDVMARVDLAQLFSLADPRYAVMVVKHNYAPPEQIKMDGQLQLAYARKNWSSVMLINCDHPGNRRLTLQMVNSEPGRALHSFCWLKDEEIGGLPERWNWLEGHSSPNIDPAIVHYTRGGPWFDNYRDVLYADEWTELASSLATAKQPLGQGQSTAQLDSNATR